MFSVMVNVLALSEVDLGFSSGWVKPTTMKLVFVASPLRTQYYGKGTKTGWLGIRIMCLVGATSLSADCCFGKVALYKSH